MTHISRDDVLALARLSSLQLADEETDSLTKNLADILDYVEQLSELDTDGIEPTYQVTGLENVWRNDEPQQDTSREELLTLAPQTANNQIKVPKVL